MTLRHLCSQEICPVVEASSEVWVVGAKRLLMNECRYISGKGGPLRRAFPARPVRRVRQFIEGKSGATQRSKRHTRSNGQRGHITGSSSSTQQYLPSSCIFFVDALSVPLNVHACATPRNEATTVTRKESTATPALPRQPPCW